VKVIPCTLFSAKLRGSKSDPLYTIPWIITWKWKWSVVHYSLHN